MPRVEEQLRGRPPAGDLVGHDGDDDALLAAATARVVSAGMERAAWFESDQPLIDRLVENTRWSTIDNFITVPTDCPQRDERLGWTGDIQAFAPVAAFHYDCYWMREFHWCDFEWDKRFFGDIESTLKRLHEDKGLHICAWINPYIGQRGEMFKEGRDKGYLVRKPNGEVWQTDFWQAGMGLVDSPTRPPVNGSRSRSRPC